MGITASGTRDTSDRQATLKPSPARGRTSGVAAGTAGRPWPRAERRAWSYAGSGGSDALRQEQSSVAANEGHALHVLADVQDPSRC